MLFKNFYEFLFTISLFTFVIKSGNVAQGLQFSITQHNKCLESNNFNIIRTFARISMPDCISECKNRHECKAINYRRRTQICELISSDNGEQVPNDGRNGPCVLVVKADIEEVRFYCSTHSVELLLFIKPAEITVYKTQIRMLCYY